MIRSEKEHYRCITYRLHSFHYLSLLLFGYTVSQCLLSFQAVCHTGLTKRDQQDVT